MRENVFRFYSVFVALRFLFVFVFLGRFFFSSHQSGFFNKSAAFCWEGRVSAADSLCLKGGENVDSNKRWEELILTVRTDLSPLLQINKKKQKQRL